MQSSNTMILADSVHQHSALYRARLFRGYADQLPNNQVIHLTLEFPSTQHVFMQGADYYKLEPPVTDVRCNEHEDHLYNSKAEQTGSRPDADADP